MSVEEDTELRDLVSQTLENNGVLSKIRAELRASVFLAVEEQEAQISKTPFVNNALKEYLSTPHGALGLCLVKEFLECLELDFTVSVFNSETRCGKSYEYEGRSKLLKDLQIKNINGKKGPLLSHILYIAQRCSETHSSLSDNKEETPGNLEMKQESFVLEDEVDLNTICLEKRGGHEENPNISLSPLNRTFVTESSSQKGLSHSVDSADEADEGKSKHSTVHSQQLPQSSEHQHRLRLQPDSSMKYVPGSNNFISHDTISGKVAGKDSGKASELNSHSEESEGPSGKNRRPSAEKTSQSRSLDSNNPMTSLNNLPPLDGIQSKKDSKKTSNSILIADIDSQEHYEEDFQSTESSAVLDENSRSSTRSHHSNSKPLKGGKESAPSERSQDVLEKDMSEKGTDTPSICEEIDENTNSEVDDLLLSTASGENTIEATISHVTSNLADYCENL